MKANRCISGVSIGCKSDVIRHMDQHCTGKPSCKMEVNDLEKFVLPCPKDYKSYLEASHICIDGKLEYCVYYFIKCCVILFCLILF